MLLAERPQLGLFPGSGFSSIFEPELLPWPPPSWKPAEQSIVDLGEKIGAARKDTARPTGPKVKTDDEEQDRSLPSWAASFSISQIAKCTDPSKVGKWTISRKGHTIYVRSSDRVYDTYEKAREALPLRVLAELHSVEPARDGGFIIMRKRAAGGKIQVVAEKFVSEKQAMLYMVNHTQEILETSTTFGESHLPNPSSYERIGTPYRSADIQGQEVMDTFGLRAIEFGNWNSQADRQQLLNAAHDALKDLALVLGLPDKSIGLNGDLGVAFGSRGHGGTKAVRAHYEPHRVVMNLTRMKGAGSLAHEWGHAFDHLLSRLEGSATSDWKTTEDGTKILDPKFDHFYLTEGSLRKPRESAMKLKKAMDTVVSCMTKQVVYRDLDTSRLEKLLQRQKESLQYKIEKIRNELIDKHGDRASYANKRAERRGSKLIRKVKTADEAAMKSFELLADRLMAADIGEWTAMGSAKRCSVIWATPVLLEINELCQPILGRSGLLANGNGYLDDLAPELRNMQRALADLDRAAKGGKDASDIPTAFAFEATQLNYGRSDGYWTRPREMFARAFSAYVHDKLKDEGIESNFLNYAPEDGQIVTPWGSFYPFPRGAERKNINQAIDELLDLFRATFHRDGSFKL